MFDLERLKAGLAEKITSIDAFVELLHNARTSSYVVEYTPRKVNDRWQGTFHGHLLAESDLPFFSYGRKQFFYATLPPSRWWMAREAMRVAVGLRTSLREFVGATPLADALDRTFAYISANDPSKIAYTASIEDGERDKQTIVSAGRIGRVNPSCWGYSDDTFRDLDSTLRAEASNELEILTGPAIEEAWQIGPETCMTEGKFRENRSGYWERDTVGTHPVMVYDAPGWGVAVIRSGEKISQRAVVYTDPESGKKYHIRVYGSGPLARRLQRNGYVNELPYGAKLKLIPAPNAGENRYVCPYLDSATGTNNGNGVKIENGWLVITSPEETAKIQRIHHDWVSQGSTGGHVHLLAHNIKPWVSLFGAEHDGFTVRYKVARLTDSGELETGDASQSEINNRNMTDAYVVSGGVRTNRYVDRQQTTVIGGGRHISHRSSYEYHGYVEVTAEQREVLRENDLPTIVGMGMFWTHQKNMPLMEDGTRVPLPQTCNLVYMEDGQAKIKRIAESAVDKAKHRKIRQVDDVRTFVTADVPVVNVVRGGKTFKSVVGIHGDVVKTDSGTWCFRQDAKRIAMGSSTLTLAPGEYRVNKCNRVVPLTVPEAVSQYIDNWLRRVTSSVSNPRYVWAEVFNAATNILGTSGDMRYGYDLCDTVPTPGRARESFAVLKAAALDKLDNPALDELITKFEARFPGLLSEAPVAPAPASSEPVAPNEVELVAQALEAAGVAAAEVEPDDTSNILTLAA